MAVNWEDTGHTRPPEAPAKELVLVLNGSPRDVIPGSFPSSFSVSCPDVENNVNSVVTVFVPVKVKICDPIVFYVLHGPQHICE